VSFQSKRILKTKRIIAKNIQSAFKQCFKCLDTMVILLWANTYISGYVVQ